VQFPKVLRFIINNLYRNSFQIGRYKLPVHNSQLNFDPILSQSLVELLVFCEYTPCFLWPKIFMFVSYDVQYLTKMKTLWKGSDGCPNFPAGNELVTCCEIVPRD